MIIVPNEWLVELLVGSLAEQRVVHEFLDRIDRGGHVLAIRRHGRLHQKILSAMADRMARAKRLRLLLSDASKVQIVDEDEIVPMPEHLQGVVKSDDVYLVETAFAVKPCLLVTTDGPLRDILRGSSNPEVRIELLDEFLGHFRGSVG